MSRKIAQWESFEAMDETIRRDTVEVAKALHQSPNLVGRWKLPPATEEDFQQSGARNPLDRIQNIMETIGRIEPERAHIPIFWLLAKNGYLPPVKMPEAVHTQGELLQRILAWMKETGETSKTIEESLKDKRVTRNELKEIAREFREDIQAGQALFALLEEMVR